MSTSVDVSPLKMETSSTHSSPHRGPRKPSPIGSPCSGDIDTSPTYPSLGYSRDTGGSARCSYSSSRSGFDVSTDTPTTKSVNLSVVANLPNDLPSSASPVLANFLTNEESESSPNRTSSNLNNCSSPPEDPQDNSPDDQKQQRGEHSNCDTPKEDEPMDTEDMKSSREPVDKISTLSYSDTPHLSPPGKGSDSSEVVETDRNEGEDDEDDGSDRDDDQIECAECNRVFCNLQSYMDHTCYRTQVASRPERGDTPLKSSSSLPNFLEDRHSGEAESFRGKLVYNMNGSAYIIESSCVESGLDMDLPIFPDSIVIREDQSVLDTDRSIPRIATAVFLTKRLSSSSAQEHSPSDAGSVMQSYHVFDLNSGSVDELLQTFLSTKSQRDAMNPVLMCFICRLTFHASNSLLKHLATCHAVDLTENKKSLICRPCVSTIIQIQGPNKAPVVSVLQPVVSMDPDRSDSKNAYLYSRTKLPERSRNVSLNVFSHSGIKTPVGDYDSSTFLPHGRDTKTLQDRGPFCEQQDLISDSAIGSAQRSSTPQAIRNSFKRENYMRPSPPVPGLLSVSDSLSVNHRLQTPQQVAHDSSTAGRLRSSPSVLSSVHRVSSSPSSSGSESFLQTSSTASKLPSSAMPPLVLPTSNPASLHPHVDLSSAPASLQSLGLHMPNFLGSCDDHPQGRAQGVECPKCDMVLSSSQSLGGHMTMTHSRNSCKTLKCPKCNWHYKYQETLEIHMKEKHPDSDAQCVYCLTNQAHPRLARGESYSCGYKPYRCEVCNYSTTTKGNLSIHMQSDKHINNMQDLANGSADLKMQPQQPQPSQSLPPSASTPLPNNASSYSQEDAQYKKMKQKQSFRCDVCSYETSVARNLRIHMTSEKHTHNMLVMTQSINHLHQDMTLHQMSQMNQLLAMNQQEQAARFAAINPHIPSNMFSYEQTAMLMSAASNPPPPPSNYEIPINLTKENGLEDAMGPISNKDATKMFQCCICNKYGSDSMENVHNHIQYDRTKSGNSDAHVTFSNGTYHCNLCSYKTHLKANFQLHCKTDKHLQKLQFVNHILEGGPENEWRLTYSGSPMQIACNACSFYANSTHKMQLHLSTIQHESCAQLFRHLQLLDHATPASAPGSTRYYSCTLCAANVHTKQKLVLHSRSPHHIRKEQTLPQGQISIFDVYLIKEMTPEDSVDFEDGADDTSDRPDATETPRDLSNNSSGNNYNKTTGTPGPPPAHSATAAAAASATGIFSSGGGRDCSSFKLEPGNKGRQFVRDNADQDISPESLGISRSLATTRTSGSPSLADNLISNGINLSNNGSKCGRNDSYSSSIGGGSLDCRILSPSLSSSIHLSQGARLTASTCILCPLCQHECQGALQLEGHLIKEHNVAQEGLQRLMSMVDMPAAVSSTPVPSTPSTAIVTTTASSSSPPTSSTTMASPVSETTASAPLSSSSSSTAVDSNSTNDLALSESSHKRSENMHEMAAEPRGIVTATSALSRTGGVTAAGDVQSSSSSSQPSLPPSASSSSLVTPGSAPMNLSANQISEQRSSATATISDETREINLESVEAEHESILTSDGVDLAAQERLDKEFEDLFRCQTCSKSFSNIDQLYSHQNELGHLELKQTPRGPGYLCWKKGCNQYFKTASALQVHFREIHAKRSSAGILSPQELELYKFKCGQCSYSFRSLEAQQKHTLIHLMQALTQCRVCCEPFNSLSKMRRHLETEHGDLSLAEMTEHMESIEGNASLLFSSPAYEHFTAKVLLTNGSAQVKNGGAVDGKSEMEEENMMNGMDMKENIERQEEDMDESDGMTENFKEKQFLEEYMNSQSIAEEYYKDNNRKFKCHLCRVAFTNQKYLIAHNKTVFHKQNEQSDGQMDSSRPYRCDVCKESFTQKSILLVHNNSVSHLHKLKQQPQVNGDNLLQPPTKSHSTPPPLSSSPRVISPSIASQANGNCDSGGDNHSAMGNSIGIKPYKCNICKVSYNNQPSIEIHLRSVGHKTKASKLGELIQTGQVDLHQALIEHPDPRTAGKQQAQLIADMIHQQATAQAASNVAASYFHGMQGLNAMAQLSLLGVIPSTSHPGLTTSAQNALAAMSNTQLEAYYGMVNPQFNKDGSRADTTKVSSASAMKDPVKEKGMKINSNPDLTEKIVNMVIKQDGKIEPAGSDNKLKLPFADDKQAKALADLKLARREDDLPPNFHAPIIARPRGFMGRFKPQLHRSLLENFGFECVMHYNEEHTDDMKEGAVKVEENTTEEGNEEEMNEKEDSGDKEVKMETEEKSDESKENEGENKEDETQENNAEAKDEKKDENKENIDLPELNKCSCKTCHKDFSNVWVLKNHEEEIHNHFVAPEMIETFGQKFKEKWEKTLPKPQESDLLSSSQPPSNPPTPTIVTEKVPTTEMPPPPPPTQPQLPANFDMSQLLPLMGMNLLPMHLPMNLVNLGLQSSLMPSLMMPAMDFPQSYLPQMPPPPMADSPGTVSSQQQLQAAAAAAAAAQNQKRVRTRISDDQLKVLRQYFDINNSPSEEQINKMSDQTGLPQKVIKHWFRNTLFKERQRNKDSPYNFNNPPSTSIDLDEYDRTGKIPEVKLEPEEEDDATATAASDAKKDDPAVVEECTDDKDVSQDSELQEKPPLKIDLAPKSEPNDDGRRDQESHSNTSSPSMSSIPSTPTASAPATPTPMITANAIGTPNPLAFSLDAYAANMARLEAATFQSMGKRANRTRFTDYQIKTLQDYFERNAYPKDDELEHLSKLLGLSARVIVVWFQNARQKARKIYENQPANESNKDSNNPFQRTPGLNYQCKKCNSVFQRYYELIKHQKNSCVGESNNNKPIPSMTEDDSNLSYSNDDSCFSERQNTPSSTSRDRDLQSRSQIQELSQVTSVTAMKGSVTTSAPITSAQPSSSSSSSSIPSFKCDKCSLTFNRFDMWQEHQKAHNVASAMFTPFSSSSAFGMLQTLAHQEDNKAALAMAAVSTPSSLLPAMVSASHQPMTTTTPTSTSTSPSPSSKRKTDSEDEGSEQPRDKRLRTTILPEQLDYLYQQYQIDCNPSRKQLEHIASTVNLKKRVVQVWFQNTRARERKGHYRAHQQLINKRCPFCRALFRAKSALESHLATKHPEEMAKGDINVDLIPDAMIEPPTSHSHSPLSSSAGHGSSSSHSPADISKLLPPGAAATMPNYMAFMSSAGGLFPGPTPEMLGHPSFDDPFFKKYMSDLASNMAARQEHPSLPSSHSHLSAPTTVTAHSNPKPQVHQTSPVSFPTSRPLDAHKPKSSSQQSVPTAIDDTPLDLSKPVKPAATEAGNSESHIPRPGYSGNVDFNERSMEMDYLRRLSSMDDSFSETQSEMADHEYMNDVGSSPPSPARMNNSLNHHQSTPGSAGKRYRTQMSATQVKVMKHLFQDYKTPTMAECELLGQEIGLAKRVVQVWFQNARAKEKKAKLNSGKPYNADVDFPKAPEECKLCSYKYSHKVTVQDHIFTKGHIDRVKAFLNSDGDRDLDLSSLSNSSLPGLSRTPGEAERARKMWDESGPSSHLAQLQAMGINPASMGFPLGQGESNVKTQEKDAPRKDKKADAAGSKDEQQQAQAAMEMAMNAQMLSALGSYMPGLDPAYLSYMYSGLPGYFPGMGIPMMQPGLMPDQMMTYDPLVFGTPLGLLQIPAAAIKSVSDKLTEPGALLARYTQDCQALADLHNVVSAADLTVVAEATLDVGYICKKCQMVYPARDSCIAHQRSVCLASSSSLPKGFEPIMKLEQVQYECRACSERFSTILEFKAHCQQESHKSRLMKFKAQEAARREAAGSPSSSAPYASSASKVISPSPSYLSKTFTTSPSNNNNSSSHNNNRVTTPSAAHTSKPALVPSPAHQYNKMSPATTSPAAFREKHSPVFGEMNDIKRLKAE